MSGELFPLIFTTSGQSYLQFSSWDNEIHDCVSQEKPSLIFHGVIHDLFMCCVSENGRCHAWPQPIEFSGAALSCSMLSHLPVFRETGRRLVQPSVQGSCFCSVIGQETCELRTCNKMLVHSPKERKKEREKKKPVCLLQLCTESELFSLLFCVLLAFPMSEDVWCYFLQALKWNGLVCWRFVLYQLRTLVLDTSEYWLNLFLLLPVRFSHLPLLWGFMLFFCFCFSNS